MIPNNQTSNEKTKKQGFIISMDDAKIIKFNLDVIRKEIARYHSTNTNASQCLTQITQILAKNKKKNTIVLREG